MGVLVACLRVSQYTTLMNVRLPRSTQQDYEAPSDSGNGDDPLCDVCDSNRLAATLDARMATQASRLTDLARHSATLDRNMVASGQSGGVP